MAEEDCGLCLFPDLRDKLNVFNRLSIVTSGRMRQLPLLIFKRCEHSKQLIYLSQNDFLILLALVWCQNYNVDGVKIHQTNHSKALGLNIDENLSWIGRSTHTQFRKKSPPVSVHLSESYLSFPCTLFLKYRRSYRDTFWLLQWLFRMACLDSWVRKFKKCKIVLPEWFLNQVMMRTLAIVSTCLAGITCK